MPQITDRVVMIRPKHFGFNPETAENNTFQSSYATESEEEIAKRAVEEFDALVAALQSNLVHVDVIEDTDSPVKPDAVFPNNWFTTHANGALITYPMFSPLRRHERREDIIEQLADKYRVDRKYTFEHYEEEKVFLEGTGSLVLDRVNKLAYACISERTDIELLNKWCVLMGYEMVTFRAISNGVPIYHTNVMMAMGVDFVVVCLDCIPDEEDRKKVLGAFERTGKNVVEISEEQMNAFAGNMLQIGTADGRTVLAMSDQAYTSLTKAQVNTLSEFTSILHVPINTIERYGGGSVRCMIAENFLDVRS